VSATTTPSLILLCSSALVTPVKNMHAKKTDKPILKKFILCSPLRSGFPFAVEIKKTPERP
jgi:hypothetical protein